MFNCSRKENKMMKKIMNFFKDEEGATAVEYGIMVAAIAAIIVAVVFSVGDSVLGAFTAVDTALNPLP
jgi:pilus assembly protein Flp/PilA